MLDVQDQKKDWKIALTMGGDCMTVAMVKMQEWFAEVNFIFQNQIYSVYMLFYHKFAWIII